MRLFLTQYGEKKMSKKRSDAYEPKWIRFYRNGDPFFLGKQLVITKKKYPSLEVLLSELTTTLNLQHGAVRRVYTPTRGTRINFLHQLVDKHEYVVSSGEKFKPLPQGYQSAKTSVLPRLARTRLSQGGGRRKQSTNLQKAASYPDGAFTKQKNTITISVLEDGDEKGVPQKVALNLEVDWKHSLERIANTLRQNSSSPEGLYTVDGHPIDQFTVKDGKLYYLVRQSKGEHRPASLNSPHLDKEQFDRGNEEESRSIQQTGASNAIEIQSQESLTGKTEEESNQLRPSLQSPHESIRGLFDDEDHYTSETELQPENEERMENKAEQDKADVDSDEHHPELGRLSTDSAYRSGSSTGQMRPESILNKRGTLESLFYAKDEDEGKLLPRYMEAPETVFRAQTSDGREEGAADVPEGSDIKVELDEEG